ncbi:MAG: hypothetical protein MUF42_13715 [Cytophagaceae bacterium]|jgi:hypothetical protein|nr:hypothetical protein [Cytophagaceae bacterium]
MGVSLRGAYSPTAGRAIAASPRGGAVGATTAGFPLCPSRNTNTQTPYPFQKNNILQIRKKILFIHSTGFSP